MDELIIHNVIINEFQAPCLKSCQKVRQYKCTKLTKIVVTVAAKNVARIAEFLKKMAPPHFENVRVCVMNTIFVYDKIRKSIEKNDELMLGAFFPMDTDSWYDILQANTTEHH